ncbi:MAG: parallel beta-helix domain-containing protein [Polyangiaceae bacterium]
MRSLPTRLSVLSFVAVALAVGCGDDGSGGSGGSGAGGGSGGSGGGSNAACAGIDTSACTVALGPTDDDTTTLQTALIEAASGDVVCLCPGTYSLTNEVSVTTPNLTIRGVGATREDVVLDFAGQTGGDDGLTATSDGFTVENFSVKNSPGNGIVVTGADGVTFRNLKVSWDAGSVTDNGAYAVYPVRSSNVLIEDTEIVGAADAGAYVGQSTNIIVRNNDVHGNVAGIEIENSTDAEVYGNKAYDNAAGILVFTLPNLEKKDGLRCEVHNNEIYENNRDNFAEPGTVVAAVPPGVGMLILSADYTQAHDNTIHDNVSAGIVMVSFDTLAVLLPETQPDPLTDSNPENTYIYANTFMNNGTAPNFPLDQIPVVPLEEVVWDGIEKTPGSGALCLSMDPPTFRNINGIENIGTVANQSTDTTPFECDQTKLSPVEL